MSICNRVRILLKWIIGVFALLIIGIPICFLLLCLFIGTYITVNTTSCKVAYLLSVEAVKKETPMYGIIRDMYDLFYGRKK